MNRVCHVHTLLILTNDKHFLKLISYSGFDYDLFRKWLRIIVATNFLFTFICAQLKEASYSPWPNKYSNVRAACHIKPKFFLWNNLLENVLIAEYLISVVVTLSAVLFVISAGICYLIVFSSIWNEFSEIFNL